ncbi:MAG: lytic transglycosylase domain-containing protein [Planctomycetes bacterium]|nr:lytic transglycosylase domain-containing protein [Planctomycetota bacterium]
MFRTRALSAVAALLAGAAGAAAGWFLYPRPDAESHREEIEAAAREFDLDPALVRAVVLAESGGKADARSSRGAIGLMQLVPDTARERAKELGLSDYDLLDPAVNARLGSCHLAKLLALFDGNIALAVAAYNAGEKPVREWAERAPHLSGEEIVDAYAYDETRAYVRRVLEYRDRLKAR